MNNCELARSGGKPVSPQYPLPVNDMSIGTDRISITGETVTFEGKAAAGSVGINALDKKPILNLRGDKVGSYWGQNKNKVWGTGDAQGNGGKVTSLTETAGSAAIVITDLNNDLELLFEGVTTARYVLRVYDASGGSLYGFIGGISTSSNVYTISIFSAVGIATQDWVGTLGSFDNTESMRAEIYSYETSFAWVTGTVLTREVNYDFNVPESDQLNRMTAGDYAIDYESGKILYKRATTGASDTCNYMTPSGNMNLVTGDIEIGAVEIKNASSDDRVNVSVANTARTTSTMTLVTQEVGADGTVPPTGSLVSNAPFAKITDGTSTVDIGVDEAAMAAIPEFLPVGGEYRATATTYTDGDAAILQMDKYGQLKISGSSGVSGGGLSLYILTSTNATGHGTTAYTAATQFTISVYNFTVNPRLIQKIERYSSAGVYQETITPLSHAISEASGVFTVTGMSASSGDLFSLYILGSERTIDISLDAGKAVILNPRTATTESIADTTNVASATYYPASTGKEMSQLNEHLSITGKLIDGAGETTTLIVEVTNDEDTTNADWAQIYGYDSINNTNVNSMAATNQTTEFAWFFDVANWRYYRYGITTTAATNTVIIKERVY